MDQSSGLITRCHPMKQARCGPICANVDGTARRRKRSPGIRCRIENCVQSFTAVFDLARSRDRTFIAMVAEYCGHSLSIRTAEIADYMTAACTVSPTFQATIRKLTANMRIEAPACRAHMTHTPILRVFRFQFLRR